MKDLLADLQVDDGDDLFSLDQLEKELASMDHGPPLDPHQPPPQFPSAFGGGSGLSLPPLNVASLINAHAQERSSGMGSGATTDVAQPAGTDAWSLSLQNFASLSLQEDFLAADSARKKTQQQQPVLPPPKLNFDGAEEYDIKEKLSVAPPPGLGAGLVPLPSSAAADAVTAIPPIPPKQNFPRTPQNSINIPRGGDLESSIAMREAILSAVQAEASKPVDVAPTPTSQPSSSIPPQETGRTLSTVPTGHVSSHGVSTAPPPSHPPQPPQMQQQQQLHGYYPQGPLQFPPGGPHMGPPVMATMIPPGAVPMGIPMPIPMGQPLPPHMAMPMPPTGTGVVMGAAVPTSGPAWQTPNRMVPPPMIPQQQAPPSLARRVFCNPLPSAPPIPASALETSYMSGRDIAFVVHGILKPVLSAGVSEDDYYLQYLRRRGGPQSNPVNPKKVLDLDQEMSSRESKAKEWASEKATLGYVAKSNVARPRALIATPKPKADQEETEEKKQRANLWKARVYCDQAYQAYQRVIEIWRMAPPGSVPPQVQVHLAKLMKCMGIALDENKVYSVDAEPLKLLTKLGKGRTLIARVLEQALLPPNAVQAVMPNLLDVIMTLPTDATTERVFRSVASVLVKLQSISSQTLIRTLEVVDRHGKISITSPAKMECAHALLSKGAQVVRQDPSEEAKAAWGTAEGQFMALLQTV
jgi:hypothetical protein